jgi:hypothetical protein
MRRLLWYGNSSGSDRNPNSSDNPVCLSVQSYGTYCQEAQETKSWIYLGNLDYNYWQGPDVHVTNGFTDGWTYSLESLQQWLSHPGIISSLRVDWSKDKKSVQMMIDWFEDSPEDYWLAAVERMIGCLWSQQDWPAPVKPPKMTWQLKVKRHEPIWKSSHSPIAVLLFNDHRSSWTRFFTHS